MDRAPADGLQELVADLLHPQGVLDHLRGDGSQVEGGWLPEQVGRLQQVDVQGMAFDVFAAVHQAAQGVDLRG